MYLYDGPSDAQATLILAHGAGAPMDSAFMNTIAAGVGAAGTRVVRFEFPYMHDRRKTGKKRAPNSASRLEQSWLEVIEEFRGSENLAIGGKSMGGRIASMVADRAGVQGLVCLGYPFHPAGKPEKLRVDHLAEMCTPALILQGERDVFGSRDEVAGYALSGAITVEFVQDGDHSFKPRKKSGLTHDENLQRAVASITEFLGELRHA